MNRKIVHPTRATLYGRAWLNVPTTRTRGPGQRSRVCFPRGRLIRDRHITFWRTLLCHGHPRPDSVAPHQGSWRCSCSGTCGDGPGAVSPERRDRLSTQPSDGHARAAERESSWYGEKSAQQRPVRAGGGRGPAVQGWPDLDDPFQLSQAAQEAIKCFRPLQRLKWPQQ